jgi:hypothetical protein
MRRVREREMKVTRVAEGIRPRLDMTEAGLLEMVKEEAE